MPQTGSHPHQSRRGRFRGSSPRGREWPQPQKMAGNKKVEYLTVYSKSLEMEPLGKQADLPAGKQGLVHDDIILIKLAPGQVRASPLSDA